MSIRKNVSWILIFSFFCYVTLPPVVLAQQAEQHVEKKISIAVTELDNKGGMTTEECSLITNSIRQALFGSGWFRVVNRENMEMILSEQGFQRTVCISNECVVKVGRLLGVQKMVMGSMGLFGNEYVFDLQLVNVETGEIEQMFQDRCACTKDQLLDRVTELAKKIMASTLPTTWGGIRVISTPEGATVYLNESEVGRAPLELLDLKPAEYQVRLYLEGYEQYEGTSQVVAGDIIEMNVPLKQIANPAFLEISANVSKADIFLNEHKVGETPLPKWPVRPGKHQVKVGLGGYYDWQTQVKVSAGESKTVQAQLKKKKKVVAWYLNPWIIGAFLALAGGSAAAIAATTAGGGSDSTRTVTVHY